MIKTVKFTDLNGFGGEFTSSPETSPAAVCIDFNVKDGRLTDGFSVSKAFFGSGASPLNLPNNAGKEALFIAATTAGERILLAADNKIYCADAENAEDGFSLAGITYGGVPKFANVGRGGGYCAVIGDGNGKLTFFDGYETVETSLGYGVEAVREFCGRLVAVTDSKVYISAYGDPLDFSDFSGGCVIDLGASFHAKNAVVYGNELVIAGTRGMCRIVRSEFGNAFTLKPVYTDGEALITETLAACADGVYVLCERGLARYNGAEVTFSHPETAAVAGEGICGFIERGEYRACVKAPDNAQKRWVLTFAGGKCRLSATPIVSVTASLDGSTVYALTANRDFVCKTGGASVYPSVKRRYETSLTDFGIEGVKTLSSFSFYSEKDVLLFITADGKRRLYRVVGGKGRRIIRPHIRGVIFSFGIVAEGNGVSVGGLRAEIEY